MVPNTVLWSTVCVKNTVLGSTVRALIYDLMIKKSIAPVPNIKSWGKNTVLHSTGNYVGNVFFKGQESNKSGTQW